MMTPTATLKEAATDVAAETSGKKPVKVFRHRALSASVFENSGKNDSTWHSVALQRAYKTDDGFRHSSSFTRDEIPVARHLLDQAWQFILDTEASRKHEETA